MKTGMRISVYNEGKTTTGEIIEIDNDKGLFILDIIHNKWFKYQDIVAEKKE